MEKAMQGELEEICRQAAEAMFKQPYPFLTASCGEFLVLILRMPDTQ